jgi:phosphate transport system ATP-binding protein
MDNHPAEFSVRELRVRFKGREVLKGLTQSFSAGRVTAIIGPSGCGKTTFIRTLNRLTELVPGAQIDGRVQLDAGDVSRMDPVLLRRQVGMVFQKPNPFPMSIRDNVLFGLRAAGERIADPAATVRDSLSKAALWEEVKDRLSDSAFALSLGQQQRLCIARCLATRPRVVLMDEPAASLDPISTYHLEKSIEKLKGAFTVVIVTHDLQQARRVAENTIFMLAGNIVESGPTRQLFEYAADERTRAYVAGRIVLTGEEMNGSSLQHAATG